VSLYLRILSYLRPYTGVFALAVLATSVFAALDAFSLALLIPFLRALFAGVADGPPTAADPGSTALVDRLMDGTLGRFVDLTAPRDEAIQGIILFILGLFLIKNVFDFARIYMVAWIEQSVTRDLRDEVYDHLVELDLVFFLRTRVGQMVSRLTHDVEQLRTLVTKELAKILSSGFELAAALSLMALISWQLTLASIVVLPGVFSIWGPLLKRGRKGDRRVLDLAGDVHSHLQETLSGIRLVKASAAEEHERRRFHRITWAYFKSFVRTERYRALANPVTEMVGALGTVLILWYGTQLVFRQDGLSPEDFIGFIALSMKLYAPVKYLGKLPAIIQPGIVAAERAFEFLDAPVEIRDRPNAREFPGVEQEIEFQDVSFEYRLGEPVLSGISFRAPAGTVTALVGPSGAGKTTLVDLMGRFYEPSEGQILVDGEDIREFSVRSLRERLGVVSQETVLFHDTVRSNIAYGFSEQHPEEELERAARAAHAHEFIERLADRYQTVVGERGTQLSGGQRQRIAIARAILRDPPILILDEATSALDSESERLVQEAMEQLLVGRTTFVIAHRLSTVKRAHQILVLDKGRIVQSGTHEALLEEGGLYGYLYDLQFRSNELEGAARLAVP
jgi:subfamily B ATP-binding cassette protein MsbA